MKVWIVTYELSATPILADDGFTNRQEESNKRIDWNNSSDRKWFMNHLTWCLNNNRAVHIEPDSN